MTVTHARIRAAQGDVRGARSILECLLREQPAHAEARTLLRSLASLAERDHHEEAGLEPAAPVAADPRRLAAPFRRALGRERDAAGASRIRRLERWLERVAPQRDS